MYTIKCPNSKDFQDYINGDLGELKVIAFEKHLNECELCKEALSGYKIAFLNSIASTPKHQLPKPKYHLRRRLLPYAAAVLILASLLFSQLTDNWSYKKDNLADNSEILVNTGKTLMHKTDADYWYVGNESRIAFNDQLVAPAQINEVLKSESKVGQIFIQIEETNLKTADDIVSVIKSSQSVPVYTYSKQTLLKSN